MTDTITLPLVTVPANGNGNGNGNGGKHTSRSLVRRPVSKMSWERNPADGSVTFTPDEGETLAVDGDSVLATVTAHESRPTW